MFDVFVADIVAMMIAMIACHTMRRAAAVMLMAYAGAHAVRDACY